MLKIKILKANNVNTVNTQPAELMQSTKSVDVSTETMSKTIFFPEFSYEVVRVNAYPKYTSATKTICLFHIGQLWSKPKVAYNEWVTNLHFSAHSDNSVKNPSVEGDGAQEPGRWEKKGWEAGENFKKASFCYLLLLIIQSKKQTQQHFLTSI